MYPVLKSLSHSAIYVQIYIFGIVNEATRTRKTKERKKEKKQCVQDVKLTIDDDGRLSRW